MSTGTLPDIDLCCQKLKHTFTSLSSEELKSLLSLRNICYYPKGSLLYEEGTRTKGCYFVYSGIIKIYQTGHEGKEQIIKFDREGDILVTVRLSGMNPLVLQPKHTRTAYFTTSRTHF